MSDTKRTGTILVRKGTLFPPKLKIERQPFLSGWAALTKLDGYGLSRLMKEVNWNFFCLAGEVKVNVLGRDGDMAVRRAVKKILAKLKNKKFNSLEITKVVSKRFFGVPYVRVFAHSRHIQGNIQLGGAEESASKTHAPPNEKSAPSGGEGRRRGEVVTNNA